MSLISLLRKSSFLFGDLPLLGSSLPMRPHSVVGILSYTVISILYTILYSYIVYILSYTVYTNTNPPHSVISLIETLI